MLQPGNGAGGGWRHGGGGGGGGASVTRILEVTHCHGDLLVARCSAPPEAGLFEHRFHVEDEIGTTSAYITIMCLRLLPCRKQCLTCGQRSVVGVPSGLRLRLRLELTARTPFSCIRFAQRRWQRRHWNAALLLIGMINPLRLRRQLNTVCLIIRTFCGTQAGRSHLSDAVRV